MAMEKWVVGAVGVGPMGTILASCLAEAGAEIVVADLPQRIAQVRKDGLRVRRADRRFEYRVGAVDSIRSMAGARPDCMFVATKAHVLGTIMPEVAEAAGENCLVISAQNGIGTEDEIARYVPPENVARMIINYAAGMDEEGVAHVAWFNPPNFFGHLVGDDDPRLARFVDMLNSVDVPTDLVDAATIKKKAFFKTTLNAALMPLCAVMGTTMKEAIEGRATSRIARDVLEECLSVAGRLGYDYGENVLETCMDYLTKGGDHHPSMSVDLRAKRRTEIEFINGKVLEIGRRFKDLDLEANRLLVSLVMAQEVRNGSRSPDEFPDYLGCS